MKPTRTTLLELDEIHRVSVTHLIDNDNLIRTINVTFNVDFFQPALKIQNSHTRSRPTCISPRDTKHTYVSMTHQELEKIFFDPP